MNEQITGRGDKVIARCHGGTARVLVVWGRDDHTKWGRKVYLTSEEMLPQMIAGASTLGPIGFPAEDVFTFDDGFDLQRPDWSRLKPWQAEANRAG